MYKNPRKMPDKGNADTLITLIAKLENKREALSEKIDKKEKKLEKLESELYSLRRELNDYDASGLRSHLRTMREEGFDSYRVRKYDGMRAMVYFRGDTEYRLKVGPNPSDPAKGMRWVSVDE